jgi:hypothetical protein
MCVSKVNDQRAFRLKALMPSCIIPARKNEKPSAAPPQLEATDVIKGENHVRTISVDQAASSPVAADSWIRVGRIFFGSVGIWP